MVLVHVHLYIRSQPFLSCCNVKYINIMDGVWIREDWDYWALLLGFGRGFPFFLCKSKYGTSNFATCTYVSWYQNVKLINCIDLFSYNSLIISKKYIIYRKSKCDDVNDLTQIIFTNLTVYNQQYYAAHVFTAMRIMHVFM